MEMQSKTRPSKNKDLAKLSSIYSRCLITRKLVLPASMIGKNLTEMLEKKIISMTEGKCLVEGFVKPKSVKMITHSSGIVESESVFFEIVFEQFTTRIFSSNNVASR
jgi:hypothetical protein